ncbi:MAG: tripartite tricarboxylate transporter substrate binding protein [Alcaligenaceae bacterium]
MKNILTVRACKHFIFFMTYAIIIFWIDSDNGITLAATTTYPSRAVTLIVPQAAGGTSDFVARVIAGPLSVDYGQQFIVENRPGAGGNIGTQTAAKAQPDGYTLLVTVSTHAINAAIYKELPYDPINSFAPIMLIAKVPFLLVVHPSVPVNSVADLIAYAKQTQEQLTYASAGNSTINHLLGEMFKSMTGINMLHIPYRGVADATNNVLGGHVKISFASMPSVLSQVNEDKLRAIGISSAHRSAAAPNIPTIGETVNGYSADLWVGLFGIAGTPTEIVNGLHANMAKILATPSIRDGLKAQGAELIASTPEQLAATLKEDLEKWAQVVKSSGAKVD